MSVAGPAVTVFGGTGFLGRRVVRRLLDRGLAVRVASRHPERGRALFGEQPGLAMLGADLAGGTGVIEAVTGAAGVVNAVSLYVERGGLTFRAVHVDAAERLARHAAAAGVRRLVHLSGIGADPASPSAYVRSRGEGEAAVRGVFPAAVVIRPAVMVGEDDAFLVPLLSLLRRLPAFPLFGRGETRVQPVWADDVAEAVARLAHDAESPAPVYELAGPTVYRYAALLRRIAELAGIRARLVPVPFAAWRTLGTPAELLPSPPVTRNQIELMQIDNVADPAMPGFDALGMTPRPVEALLQRIAPA